MGKELNQLIIIGNGFDLRCNLNSRFQDFFVYRYGDFSQITSNFKKLFDNQPTITYNYKEILQDIKNLNINELTFWDLIVLNMIIDGPKKNLELEWSDFEGLIERVLKGNVKLDKKEFHDTYLFYETIANRFIKPYKYTNSLVEDTENKKQAYELFNNIYIIFEKKYFNQKNGNGQEWITIFDKANDNDRIKLIKSIILKELNALENEFVEYLKDITQEDPNYLNEASLLFKNLFENDISNDELDQAAKINSSILTFNYTQPITQNEKFNPEIYYSRNVHGNITDKNIIFGIDYGSNQDSSLVEFTKTYRTLKFTDQPVVHNLFDHSLNKIKIYGHSLNRADESYFYAIFDSIDLYSCKTQLYFYYSPYDGFDKNILFKNINRLIQGYGETISKDHGKSLLHKLILEGRIHIKELYEYYKIDDKSVKEEDKTDDLKKLFKRIDDIVMGNHISVKYMDIS